MISLSSNTSNKLLSSLGAIAKNRLSLLKPLQTASICHKDDLDPVILANKPKAWDWERKKFSHVLGFIGVDRNIERFDENSVVISIEGNIGVGKSTFAKALTDALGMRFYPEPDFDLLFKRADGFDFRTMNYRLPESYHFVDHKLFYLNPDHRSIPMYQHNFFLYRVWQYMDVLAHVLSTGQGVVTDRSPWSCLAFQTAAHKMKFGFCGKSFLHFCKHVREEVTPNILRPHVVIYLDAPADVCLDRVRKRGIPHEVNSKAMCKEYLEHIEFTYKDHILPELEGHSEVLVYDWQDPPDIDLVIDDLSSLNVHEHAEGEKMEDWRYSSEYFYDLLRRYYTLQREEVYGLFNRDRFWAPDMLPGIDDLDPAKEIFCVLGPKTREETNHDKPMDALKTFLAPNFIGKTYLDRIEIEKFPEPRPRRPPPPPPPSFSKPKSS